MRLTTPGATPPGNNIAARAARTPAVAARDHAITSTSRNDATANTVPRRVFVSSRHTHTSNTRSPKTPTAKRPTNTVRYNAGTPSRSRYRSTRTKSVGAASSPLRRAGSQSSTGRYPAGSLSKNCSSAPTAPSLTTINSSSSTADARSCRSTAADSANAPKTSTAPTGNASR